MTHHKNFSHESQDARRHDQHKEVHPNEPTHKSKSHESKYTKQHPTHHKKK